MDVNLSATLGTRLYLYSMTFTFTFALVLSTMRGKIPLTTDALL